jgi:Na+-driven multidrug efflux pump
MKATMIAVGTAFVFPVLLLGGLWNFGLDGIWFNFVGVNILAAALSVMLVSGLMKEIRKREAAKEKEQINE